MYQATVLGGQPLLLTQQDHQWLINGLPAGADIIHLQGNQYHLIRNGQSISLEVVSADYHNKQYQIKVDGQILTVDLKDKTMLLLEQMGLGAKAKPKLNDLKAPMPGLIVEVQVQPGQVVHKGDVLLVLEAMKMENAIKADHEATVDQIKVQKGDKVEKGTVLITFLKEATA